MAKRPWPRLSELPGDRHPGICQACGLTYDLTYWQEHDSDDQPEQIIVVLCETCAANEIEKHPRLYRQLETNEPFPGAMGRFRDGTRCLHPDLKANGGAGLGITHSVPTRYFISYTDKAGRRRGSSHLSYVTAPSKCKGREAGEVIGRVG